MTNITFIQPRHNYAQSEGLGHIYLSTPLLSVKARLLSVLGDEQRIDYVDANLQGIDYSKLGGIVGINLVGAPYIPEVIRIIEQISESIQIVLGGQIISSLTDAEFQQLFNKNGNVINGNKVENLESLFSLKEGSIPNAENVNLIKAYEDIDDHAMKMYLEREFSIYVSQGCKYNCSFCQASKKKPEKYRDLLLFEEELLYLVNRAESFGLSEVRFYMSNLDIFQTPDLFSQFLNTIENINSKTNVKVQFRGLAGVDSFLYLYKNNIELLKRAKSLGLTSVGYGIDGATPEVWKAIGKGQNFKSNSKSGEYSDQEKTIDTIKHTSELGIIPEVLMVFGHPGETNESLEKDYNFCKDMLEQYGALPRPHVSKTIIPGADGWYTQENKDLVGRFIKNPDYFQALDYTALPSELTHSDESLRKLVRKWYKKICSLSQASTQYIIPDTLEYQQIARRLGTTVEKMNEGKFDR